MKKLLVVTVLVFAVFIVSIPQGSAETMYVCVTLKSGTMRYVGTSPTTCRVGEDLISWNKAGPPTPTPPTPRILGFDGWNLINNSINGDCNSIFQYSASPVLSFTPEYNGHVLISAQMEYNFWPIYRSGIEIGFYVSNDSTPPSGESDLTAYANMGFGGSLAHDTFGGTMPVYVQSEYYVSGGNTYYLWSGVRPTTYDCSYQIGAWRGRYTVTLHDFSLSN